MKNNLESGINELVKEAQIEKPEQDDYDLFVSMLAEGGHGVNWKGYRDEWDNMRKAGFDLPEKREGWEFSHDPSTRTMYRFKYDKYGDPHLTPIKRIK